MAADPLETSHPLQQTERYRLGAIAFHWAMFVLVVVVGVLGLLHDSWPKQTQAFWINVHALIGILLWLVLLARFGYRLRHSPPTLPSDVGAFSRRFSGPLHLVLYALMFLIPIIGFVTLISGSKRTRRYLSPPRMFTDIWRTRSLRSRVCMQLRPCGTILDCMTVCWRECGRRDATPSA
jgi:cytochrome b561